MIPSEVIAPPLVSRMEQRDELLIDRVLRFYLDVLIAVAALTGQRQVFSKVVEPPLSRGTICSTERV